MTTPKNSNSGKRWTAVLATTGLAVAAAVAWGGICAVSTVAKVGAVSEWTAAAPLEPLPGLASVSGDLAGSAHHDSSLAALGGQLQTRPEPAAKDMPEASRADEAAGTGNKPEVSLNEAANAEVGPAAGAKRDGRDRSSGLTEQSAVDPAAVLGSKDLSLGGCLPQYGDDGQCLPAVPPSQSQHFQDMKAAGLDPGSMAHNWSCPEVREYFPKGLTVRQAKVDPQKLDTNDDGLACGPAD
jgi:hypothetical protein